MDTVNVVWAVSVVLVLVVAAGTWIVIKIVKTVADIEDEADRRMKGDG